MVRLHMALLQCVHRHFRSVLSTQIKTVESNSVVTECILSLFSSFCFRVTSEILTNEYVPDAVKERVKSAATIGSKAGNCGEFPCNNLEGN